MSNIITVEVHDALTHKEAAAILGVSIMTVWRWVRDGKLHAVRIGDYTYISRSAVEKVKAEREKKVG